MITAIFDLDGTLANTIEDLGDAVNYGLEKLGCPVHSYETYKKFVGNGKQKLCFRALPDDRKDDAEALCSLFDEYYSVHSLDKTRLYDGIADTLHILSEHGVVMAVATNKPQDAAREIVDTLLPDIDFVSVLGGCDYRPKKPDTAILVEIFARIPDVPNKVWIIGDSNVDIRLANNAGIDSIGCLWGFRSREELTAEGADYIAAAPSDIAEIILNGGERLEEENKK